MAYKPEAICDWRSWLFGLDADIGSIGVHLGPLNIRLESHGPTRTLGWNWWLLRVVAGKTEVRLELDLHHALLVGVSWCRDFDDFGIYAGPLDVQVEINKFWADDDIKKAIRLW